MLPIEVFNKEKDDQKHVDAEDKGKLRQCIWKEIRVSTVSNPETVDTYYGITLRDPFSVGLMILEYCEFKGMHSGTPSMRLLMEHLGLNASIMRELVYNVIFC